MRKFNVLLLLLALAYSVAFCYALGVRVNLTDSLPGKVWLIQTLGAQEKIAVGDFVVVEPKEIAGRSFFPPHVRDKYFGSTPFLKEVAGVPGDTIRHERTDVLSADSQGDWLFSYPPPQTLQKDEYWLTSDRETGFDSRYFGAVTRRAIKAKAKLLF